MEQAQVEQIRRIPMSWEEFLELPDHPRNEWVDGEVLLMPPSNHQHGFAVGRLIRLLGAHLPEFEIGPEIGVQLPRNRLRGPDIVVAKAMTGGPWLTDSPILVVEVLSPSTRTEDTLRKPTEYAEGGIGQYWLVDPELRTIDVLVNVDGRWDLRHHLDDAHPAADVEVDEHGTVPLDLREVLGS